MAISLKKQNDLELQFCQVATVHRVADRQQTAKSGNDVLHGHNAVPRKSAQISDQTQWGRVGGY